MLRRAEFNLKHYSVDGTPELLEELKAKRPLPVKNTLIYGDFTNDNVIFRNGKVTSVIDWSGGVFGDPRYDLSLAIRPKPNAIETNSEIDVFFDVELTGQISYKVRRTQSPLCGDIIAEVVSRLKQSKLNGKYSSRLKK
jgi:aminoglycoside phosphotransferase